MRLLRRSALDLDDWLITVGSVAIRTSDTGSRWKNDRSGSRAGRLGRRRLTPGVGGSRAGRLTPGIGGSRAGRLIVGLSRGIIFVIGFRGIVGSWLGIAVVFEALMLREHLTRWASLALVAGMTFFATSRTGHRLITDCCRMTDCLAV